MLNRSEMAAFSFSWRAAGCAAYAMRSVDNCIIEKKIGIDYMNVAQELRLEITGADRTKWIPPEINIISVVSWANQSFAIATRPDVQYCVQKDDDACWYADDQKGYRGGAQHVVTVDDAYSTSV